MRDAASGSDSTVTYGRLWPRFLVAAVDKEAGAPDRLPAATSRQRSPTMKLRARSMPVLLGRFQQHSGLGLAAGAAVGSS